MWRVKLTKLKKNQKTPQLTGEMAKGSVHSLTLSVSTLLSCKPIDRHARKFYDEPKLVCLLYV